MRQVTLVSRNCLPDLRERTGLGFLFENALKLRVGSLFLSISFSVLDINLIPSHSFTYQLWAQYSIFYIHFSVQLVTDFLILHVYEFSDGMKSPEYKSFVHRSDTVLQVFQIFLSTYLKALLERPTAWQTEESRLCHSFNLLASVKDADMLANKRQVKWSFLKYPTIDFRVVPLESH